MEGDIRYIGKNIVKLLLENCGFRVIVLGKDVSPGNRIVVGGAVLNKEYTEKMKADFYAKDVMETVRFAQKIKELENFVLVLNSSEIESGYIMNDKRIDTLFEFLNTPLDSGDKIFERFAALPSAVVGKGQNPLQRFVYIPGKRRDKVVLVAHIDTVWDKSYPYSFSEAREVVLDKGVFHGTNPKCGIGADCRAGCAMLWKLRNSGHSMLIVDGEEFGKHGAKYLREAEKTIFNELNRHCYMIEFDWQGTNCCLFNQVDNTKRFKKYIEAELGFIDSKTRGGTDLAILCRRICGVNLGVGYYGWHTNEERLVLSEWENTLDKVSAFLERPQKRFRSCLLPPYIRFVKRCAKKVLQILRINPQNIFKRTQS